MSAAHTPGPWSVQGRHQMEVSGPPGTIIICDIGRSGAPSEEIYATGQADARLIAAAPDLLAALASITDECHEQRKTYAVSAKAINAARAAIAKARGK